MTRFSRRSLPFFIVLILLVIVFLSPDLIQRVAAQIPAAPILLSPGYGVTTTATGGGATLAAPPVALPEFTWQPVEGATSYRIQFSQQIGFNTIPLQVTTPHTNYIPPNVGAFTDGNWYWRVRVEAPVAGNYSEERLWVKQWATSDNRPQLTYPDDGQVVEFYGPDSFKWQPVIGAARYRFQVNTSSDFSAPMSINVLTLATQYQPVNKLQNGAYFWRVIPVDPADREGLPSDVRSFTQTYLQTPELLSPGHFSEPVFTPTFRWKAARGASVYRLEYSTDSNFSANVTVVNTNNTTHTPLNPLPNDVNYYWRVKAISGQSESAYSAVRRFVKRWYIQAQLLTPTDVYQHIRFPMFSWTPVPGAAKYKIEYSRDPDFATDVRTAEVSNPFYTPNVFEASPYPVTYRWYWKVTPFDKNGNAGKETEPNSFFSYGDSTAPGLIYPFYYYPPNNFGPAYTDPSYQMHPHEDRTVAMPVFMWHRVYDVFSGQVDNPAFLVQVATDDLFTDVVWDYETENLYAAPTATNSFQPQAGVDYFWRVCQTGGIGGSCYGTPSNPANPLWSQVWRARFDESLMLGPTLSVELTRPAQAAEIADTTPLLEWFPVQGADRYQVQVSTDPTFASTVDQAEVTYPVYAAVHTLAQRSLDKNGFLTYYWRVRARVGGDWSAYSPSRYFTIAAQSEWLRYRTLGNTANRLKFGTDPSGDAAGSDDLTGLYASQAFDDWFFGFDSAGTAAADADYFMLLDTDHIENSGAPTPPGGFSGFSYTAAHYPEYMVAIEQVDGEILSANIDVYEWDTVNELWKSPRTLESLYAGTDITPIYPLDVVDVSLATSTSGWAVGEYGTVYQWYGSPTGWQAASPVSTDISMILNPSDRTPINFYAIEMASPTDGWILGNYGRNYHWEWSFGSYLWVEKPRINIDNHFYAMTHITATLPSDTLGWAVGTNGKIARLRPDATYGLIWGLNPSPYDPLPFKPALYGVSGVVDGGAVVHAVGQDGAIIRWVDAPTRQWQILASPTGSDLFDVYMLAADDGWAVGELGTILRWNGSNWSTFSSPTGVTLNSVSMASASLGYAVGDNGVVLRWNGSAWSVVSGTGLPASAPHLYAIDATGATAVAVGQRGTDLYTGNSGSSWSLLSDPMGGYVEFMLPATAIGYGEEGGSYAVSLLSSSGSSLQDSVPSDPQVPGSGHVTRFASVTERLNLRFFPDDNSVDPSTFASISPFYWDYPALSPWAGINSKVYLDPQLTQQVANANISSNAPYFSMPSYTYNDDFSQGDNTYYWRVRPRYLDLPYTAVFGAWSQPFRFERKGFVPQNLQESVTFATPTFTWDKVEGAETYQLQVDNDPQFVTREVDVTISENSYTPLNTLFNGTYYWRVRIRRRGNATNEWSEVQTFTLSLPKPGGLAPDDPDEQNALHTTPTFCWDPVLVNGGDGNPVLAAWKYRLQVSRDTTFSQIYEEAITEQTCYTPLRGYDDGTFYWRVAMYDGAGKQGDFSTPATFTKQYPGSTLLGPLSDVTETPKFEWTRLDGAASYRLQVSWFPTFTPLYEEVVTNNTSYMPVRVYELGRRYYWRVAMIDRDGKVGPYNDATILVDPLAGSNKVFMPAVWR